MNPAVIRNRHNKVVLNDLILRIARRTDIIMSVCRNNKCGWIQILLYFMFINIGDVHINIHSPSST